MVPAAADLATHPRLAWLVDALVFLLAPLVTVALYLPSGLLMPVRVATLCLAFLAGVQLLRGRGAAAPHVLLASAGLFSLMGVFAGLGVLRYREQTSIAEAVQFAFIAVSVVSLSVLTGRRRTLIALLGGWFSSAALAATVGLWELATGAHLPGNSPAQQYGHLPRWNEISSFFDNPNLYAYHLTLSLLLLPLAWYLARGWWRAGVVATGLLLASLLFATNGRMALLSLIVGAVWWALRVRWGRIAVAAGIILTGVTMALKLPPGWTVYRFVYVALDGLQWEGKSTWVRAQMAKSGWWMAQESDYLGVGPGGYANQAFNPENPYKFQQLNNAHWGMVEVLAEYGVISLMALLAALGLAVAMALRALRYLPAEAKFDRAVAHAAGIQALTLPIISISHSTWLRQPLTAVHLATLAALLAWTEVRTRRHQADEP